MVSNIVLGQAIGSTLNSINRTQRTVDNTSLRLATGLDVNSAIDNPLNFFTSLNLQSTASDFSRLLDGIGQSTRTIQIALDGLDRIEDLLFLANNLALDAKLELENTSSTLPNAVLAAEPVGYFRLNDADGSTALNLGTLGSGGDGTYTNGVSQGSEILFYGAGGLPAEFDGVNQYVAIPNDNSINTGGPFPERSVELVFQADDTNGRQVIYEEGGTVNSLNIYIDNSRLYVNGRTTNGAGYGPVNISTPVQAGTTYHVVFTQDGPGGRFTGYLNGEEFGSEAIGGFIGNHPNFNGIGAVNQNVYFHDDGPGNAPARANGSFAFNGEISDVAIYNSILTPKEVAARYTATSLPLSESYRLQMLDILGEIDALIEDANYRGINLLANENLRVDFNPERTNFINIKGRDFSAAGGLGLGGLSFQRPSQTEDAIERLRETLNSVRDYSSTLVSSLSIIETRSTFSRTFINTQLAGADDLTVADLNEEGANMLASQTRLEMGFTALALAGQSQASILDLVTGNP